MRKATWIGSIAALAMTTATAVGWGINQIHIDADGDVWTYCGAKNPIYSEYVDGKKQFWVLDRCLGKPGPQGPIGQQGDMGLQGPQGVPGDTIVATPKLRFRPMVLGQYKCTFHQRGRDVFPTCILRRAASFTPPVAG
jgi:hypothetical protein